MVTSQKMVLLLYLIAYNIYGIYFPGTLGIKTRKMDNRGSKSIISKNIIVKEQRVNGSWCDINLSHLRCTLMGFERNYQVKIPFNKIIQRRLYSTGRRSSTNLNYVTSKLPQLNEP